MKYFEIFIWKLKISENFHFYSSWNIQKKKFEDQYQLFFIFFARPFLIFWFVATLEREKKEKYVHCHFFFFYFFLYLILKSKIFNQKSFFTFKFSEVQCDELKNWTEQIEITEI